MKIKKKIKRKYYLIMSVLLIFFLTFLIYFKYTKKTSQEIRNVTNTYYKREIYRLLTNEVNNSMVNANIDDILYIYRNDAGEILYVDYNLNKTYLLQKKIINNISSGLKEGLELKLPFLIGSHNIFINNYGPKITVKINYVNNLLTNIHTKVTNYGLNNALLEVYLKINIEGQIITPIEEKKESINYDLLISSKVINGRVPNIYGSGITKESSFFNISND